MFGRRAHGGPSCPASRKVSTTLCQFRRGNKQALSPKPAGQRSPGGRERRGWGKRRCAPRRGARLRPRRQLGRGVTGLTAIKEELLGRQKAGGGAERRFHLPRAEGAGARGAGGAHCVGRSGGAGCLEAGCDWWSKAGRVGAAAREPERPLRVQSACTEAAGPSSAPRGRPEPAARAWRLHGECQVGPSPPPSLPRFASSSSSSSSSSSPPTHPIIPGYALPASWGSGDLGREGWGAPQPST